ncbi:unnamed protein product [Lampetra planeri]
MASQTFIDREKQLLEMVSALGAKMSDSDLRSVSSSTDGKHGSTPGLFFYDGDFDYSAGDFDDDDAAADDEN